MAKFLKFHLFKKKYLFKFKIGFSLFCLFFFMLFFALGIWQLHRYQYKKILLTTYQQQINSTPKLFSQLSDSINTLQFQPVAVKGRYMNQLTMFIQNRMYKNQMGFEVLTPLQLTSGKKLLLIDRGWVAKPQDKLLPTIKSVTAEQTISGYIKLLNEYQFILGKNILEPARSPLIMQKIDLNEISQITHQSFYPFVLRLNATQPNGFVRDWVVITVEPQRHLGYAIQWFLMALILLIAYFCFCYERNLDVKDK